MSTKSWELHNEASKEAKPQRFVNTRSLAGFANTFIYAWERRAVVTSLVVIVDVDGSMEVSGIGYCTGSPARMAEVIARLADLPDLRHKIAVSAFAHARLEHSVVNLERLVDFALAVGVARTGGQGSQQGNASAPASSL